MNLLRIGSAMALLAVSSSALPCCSVGPYGMPVVFNGQTNLVVWDSKNKTEHFVRSANFDSKAKDIGFIAPTPSKPDIAEAQSDVFSFLASKKPGDPLAIGCSAGPKDSTSKGLAMAAPVEVIQQVDVAGYRATTVFATDAKALKDWLTENKYVSGPEIEEWSKLYIKRGWFLTAFKVLGPKQVGREVLPFNSPLGTGTIRMSFKTDRPFNPYYVPAQNMVKNRGLSPLRLYVLSDQKLVGNIGPEKSKDNFWMKPDWKTTISEENLNEVARDLGLKPDSLSRLDRLTAYHDDNFAFVGGRSGQDDLFFFESNSLTDRIPGGVFTMIMVVALYAVRRRKQRAILAASEKS